MKSVKWTDLVVNSWYTVGIQDLLNGEVEFTEPKYQYLGDSKWQDEDEIIVETVIDPYLNVYVDINDCDVYQLA